MNETHDEQPLQDRLGETDRLIRIEGLKKRISQISGGEALFGEFDETSSEEELAFLEHVLQFEEAPKWTHAKLLLEDGIPLPPPGDLSDAEVHDVLWNVIRGLHRQRTFLYDTDHLSDRELYALLWEDLLNGFTIDMRGNMDSGCHLDITGSGSDEDTLTWLRYHAAEEDRRRWALDFPHLEIPPHEDPPHDRDRHLPKREYS